MITKRMIQRMIDSGRRKAEHHRNVHSVLPAASCPACQRARR